MWVERLALTDFRNHAALTLCLDQRPVVLAGSNGVGKTNVLEAVSLLAAGQGLRRSPFAEIARQAGPGRWAVAATLQTHDGPIDIGTGIDPAGAGAGGSRIVRVNGSPQSGSGVLADHVEIVWLTPAMDGLFTGPASERRRFLDRLVLCFDPDYRLRIGQFERAMRQRNRLLEDNVRDGTRFQAYEAIMAATGVAIAASRNEALAGMVDRIKARHERAPLSPFPWADVRLEGRLETDLCELPAVEVEDLYAAELAQQRERDRAAGRTLIGPHRTDLVVGHGPKATPGASSSTGEQKALLIGLVLAHAELLALQRRHGAPILLLDEIAAHLDAERRAALFSEILQLRSQAWMTGTDVTAFQSIADDAQFISLAPEHRRIEA